METKYSFLKKIKLRSSGATVEGILNSSFLFCSLPGVSEPTVQSHRTLKQKTKKTEKNPAMSGAKAIDYVVSSYQLLLYMKYSCSPINYRQELLKTALRNIKILHNMELFPLQFKFKYAPSTRVHFRPCLPYYKMIQRKH